MAGELLLPPFVKKFDFRGVYGRDITDANAYHLARALTLACNPKKVLVGWDTREASSTLALHLMRGFHDAAVALAYVETCPIDYVTAAAEVMDFDLSIMVTGSHNPWNWTGLLIHTRQGYSLDGETVKQVVTRYYDVLKETYDAQFFTIKDCPNLTERIEELYSEKLKSLIPLTTINSLHILVDIGDGSGDKGLRLLERLLPQVHITRINNRGVYDKSSPHIADPSEMKNMQQLIRGIQSGSFDAGFAFDSDADRVLAVDERGEYINGSLFGSALIKALSLIKSRTRAVGYAVDCGLSLPNTVAKLKQQNDSWEIYPVPVGRSLLRNALRVGKNAVTVENVGHFYVHDFFRTDSGVFSLALLLLWMSEHGKLSQLFADYPDGMRGQLFLPLTEEDTVTKRVTAYILKQFPHAKHIQVKVDGERIEVYDHDKMVVWYATRRSGYEPIQKYFWGALDRQVYYQLEKVIRSQ